MYDFLYYQVQDVMMTTPVTIGLEATVAEAELVFSNYDFNGLPVVDGERHLRGLLTKLDILKAFVFTRDSKVPQYGMIMDRKVSDIMKKDVLSVDPETPLTRVLQRMIDTRYKSIPVVENDLLVGIVAREDVLKALRLAAQGIKPDRLTKPED